MIEIRALKPRERCLINGYLCEVIRQARRTTFVREIGGRLEGNVTVQMDRKTKVAPAQGNQSGQNPGGMG